MKPRNLVAGVILILYCSAFIFFMASSLEQVAALRAVPLVFYGSIAILAALIALNVALLFLRGPARRKSRNVLDITEQTGARHIASDFSREYRRK